MYKEVNKAYKEILSKSGFNLFMVNDSNPFYRDCLLDELKAKFDCKTFVLGETDVSVVEVAITNKTLVATDKLVVIRYASKDLNKKLAIKVEGKKKKEKISVEDKLGSVFSQASLLSNRCVVILIPDKFDKKAAEKFKQKTLIEFKQVDERSSIAFIKETTEVLGGSIDDKAIKKLMTLVYPDLYLYQSELSKLVVYEPHITVKVVDELVTKSAEVVVYDLIDAIIKRNTKKAFLLLTDLVAGTSFSGLQVVSLLQRSFRYIHYALIYGDDFAKVLSMPPFLAKKYIDYAAHFNRRRVRETMSDLLAVEYSMKSGSSQDDVLFCFISTVCKRGE